MYKLKTFYNGEPTGDSEYEWYYKALSDGAEALCSVNDPECDEYEIRKDGLLLAFGMSEHLAKKEAA